MTVFLGAPGSGKGTQAKRLAQKHRFIHFSTGDILRAAVKEGTPVGLVAKGYIDRGELVPDQVMIQLIESSLSPLKASAKVILDGFPRTVPQCEALDRNPATTADRAVYFRIPNSLLVERLTGRRVCEKCGEPYHVLFLPPKVSGACGQCGGTLVQRADDSEGVVKRRLAVFDEQNGQLLAYYGNQGKLVEVDATEQVEKVEANLARLLS